jgi:hypothetical protein
MCRKPYKAVAETFQECLSLPIPLALFRVDRSIDLDDQVLRRTVEVDDEGADRVLASELPAIEAVAL